MKPPQKPAAPKGTGRPRRTAPRHLIGAAADKENTASGLISTEAALCGVDAGEWAQVRETWQSTCHSTDRMPGYEDSNGGHLQCNDFYTLHPGQMLNDEVISEISRRIRLNEPTLAFLNSWNLEKMFPLREQGHGQMLSRRTWGHLVGRRIRSEVRIVAAMHYVPGHWTFLFLILVSSRRRTTTLFAVVDMPMAPRLRCESTSAPSPTDKTKPQWAHFYLTRIPFPLRISTTPSSRTASVVGCVVSSCSRS